MESLRDVKRSMAREAAKGSCPLAFERLEFPENPYQSILSEEKLDLTLAYLLRVKGFSQYAGKTVINNVYMEVYTKVQRHKKKLLPDYGGKLCLETVHCLFRLPEGEAEKYRMVYEGRKTYGFAMSNKYILGLFACCEAARKTAAWDGVEIGHLTEEEQRIVQLEVVRDVLFQALLLDDVEYSGNELSASLYSIYCL